MGNGPIRIYCRVNGITYKQFAQKVQEINGTKGPSAIQVAGYACGSRKPGKGMAYRIHLAHPGLSIEELLYWTKNLIHQSGTQ